MTWIYVPGVSTSSAFAPAASASITPSSWHFRALERSAWSRGKPMPAPRWFQLWKRASWLQLLCGAMPEPSTADRGAALWMASLAASRASRTALPENGAAPQTNAISGPWPVASSSSPAHGSVSSKTSVGCCLRAVRNECGETFSDWALRLREDCSRRQRSARRTSGKGSSSSRWPTISASEARQGYQQRPEGMASQQNQQSLSTIAILWLTPSASDGRRGGVVTEAMTGSSLVQQVNTFWMTPRSHEVGDYQYSRGDKSKPVATLTGQARAIYSPLARTTVKTGKPHSKERRSLNPLFVEWLMGWPPGWTLVAWTDLGCSATEYSRWKARMRCALSRLASPQEAPPAQLGLFR